MASDPQEPSQPCGQLQESDAASGREQLSFPHSQQQDNVTSTRVPSQTSNGGGSRTSQPVSDEQTTNPNTSASLDDLSARPIGQQQPTLANTSSRPSTHQQELFDARLRLVNVQSRELATALTNLETTLNEALEAAITDEDLARAGFQPHDLDIGRVYFWTVESGRGSGAGKSFGGPFSREDAVAEFRTQMARRSG
ncbi:hypothetical protein HDK64DRAFT_312596 [Phyllosticta capitalensis]